MPSEAASPTVRHEVAQQRLDDRPQRSARQHGVAEVETGDAETEPAALRNGLEIAEFDQGLDQAERRPAIEIGACGNLTQGQLEGLAGETLEHGEGLADGGDIILGIFGAVSDARFAAFLATLAMLECLSP